LARARVIVVGFILAVSLATPAAAFMGDTSTSTASFGTDVLAPPSGLSGTAALGLIVNLSWTATPDAYATGYQVLRSTTSGSGYTVVGTATPRTTTTYADTPLVPGTYYYVVRTSFGNWTSAASNEVSVLAL
jgi:hypothetical protein